MRVKCLHGYFIFEEEFLDDISDFISLTQMVLSPREKYYTFEALLEAPNYSLEGKSILNFTALKTFAGKPWEVFEANGVVWDFVNDLLVPIQSITQTANIQSTGSSYWTNGLLLPGTITPQGRVKGYDAHYAFARGRWVYTEVTYV